MIDSPAFLDRLYRRYGKSKVDLQLAALERHGSVIDDPELWLRTALAGGFKFMPIERVERCGCGSDRTTEVGRFVFWNLLGMRRCDDCGVLFVSPRLTKEAMSAVFAEHYFDYSDLAQWGERRLPVFADILSILKRRNVQSVFDVGAAYGHFVKYAQEHGLKAAGSDISPRAVEIGKEFLGVELHPGSLDRLSLPHETMDAVISLDALYYAADPRAELVAMRKLIKPDGVIVLRLRNCLSSRFRATASGFRKIGRPAIPSPHLWGFTQPSITRLLEASGLVVESISPAAYSKSSFGVAQSAFMAINSAARRVWGGAPILTRSFNVIARRTSAIRD